LNSMFNLIKLLLNPYRFANMGGISFIVDFLFIMIGKPAPQHRIDWSYMSVFICPFIPNMAILLITQPANMIFSSEVPKQFQYDRSKIHFLRSQKWKPLGQIHFIEFRKMGNGICSRTIWLPDTIF